MSGEYKKTLARFEAAVRADAYRGMAPPEERTQITQELEESRRALILKLQYRAPKS